ncbi:MAG: ribokinase [Butyricicoccaceae bacterium]
MRILNFGSLNLDHIYRVEHILGTKEAQAMEPPLTVAGGKGLNQSVALAKAGAEVWQAGIIGEDGQILLDALNAAGIHTEYVRMVPEHTGHAIVQVDMTGQTAVLQYGGANFCVTEEFVDEVLETFGEGDVIVLQNQISCLPQIIEKAYEKGMKIVLNPSPYNSTIEQCDVSKVWMLIVNQDEAKAMTTFIQPGDMILEFRMRYPNTNVILTLGDRGAFYVDKETSLYQPAISVQTVDTAGAGDVFCGYFLANYLDGAEVQVAMKRAAVASAISVMRNESAGSTPTREEVEEMMSKARPLASDSL